MREKLITLMFREYAQYPAPGNTNEFLSIIRQRIEDSCALVTLAGDMGQKQFEISCHHYGRDGFSLYVDGLKTIEKQGRKLSVPFVLCQCDIDRYGFIVFENESRKTAYKPGKKTRDTLLEIIRTQLSDMTANRLGEKTITDFCYYLANPPVPNKIPALVR